MPTLAAIFFMLITPVAFAEVHTIVQTNQQFLNSQAEAKLEEIKKTPSTSGPFLVKTLKIKVGDSVQFKNLDKMVHNVYGEEFDLKAQGPGQQKAQRFEHEGHYKVKCAIHPKMKFDVEVEK